MCCVLGYLAINSPKAFWVVGLKTVLLMILIWPEALRPERISLSIVSHSTGFLAFMGPVSLSLSYKESTEASACELVQPLAMGDVLLPSILMGRPSRVFTTTLRPSPPFT